MSKFTGVGQDCKECRLNHYARGYCLNHYEMSLRQEKKLQLVVEFGEKCVDCNRTFSPCVFDFDNLSDPKNHIPISLLLTKASWERIAEEVSKCDMVCANCHRLRTAERLPGKGGSGSFSGKGRKFTEQQRENLRSVWTPEKRREAGKYNSKKWIVLDPKGNKKVIQNLEAFCRNRGLNASCMSTIARGYVIKDGKSYRAQSHKGWSCRRA